MLKMLSSIRNILKSNFKLINDLTTILQYQKSSKFLHNLKYTDDINHYSDKTFEGYLNCGAVCYITSYLLSVNGIENKLVKTLVRRDFRDFDHVFIVTNDLILDPTYRQLFRNDIVQNHDKFMHRLYNKRDYFYVGHYNSLYDLIRKYRYNFEAEYGQIPYNIMSHYENPKDISHKQDLIKVINDSNYAKNKGKCYHTLHKLLNNRY